MKHFRFSPPPNRGPMKHNTTVPRTLVREEVHFSGSFAPNGSSAVAGTSRKGLGWSVARTSAGLFTITFDEGCTFASLQSAIATVQLTTAADMTAQIGPVSLSARTVQIRTLVGATETDIAAAAGNRINFHIVFRNSAAKPEYGP